jgi:hypothetical protein
MTELPEELSEHYGKSSNLNPGYQPGIKAMETTSGGVKVTMEYETWLRLREFFLLSDKYVRADFEKRMKHAKACFALKNRTKDGEEEPNHPKKKGGKDRGV